ncbi:hypothetical protein EVAR_37182_1 [Eumeta japonica]|uniref:Uncharacterized protein n=1 Tax=Eumeta variegata TaxID=151549 RepID=A0A4C1WLM4_EUMVA|nr:hypothetical protein EVAR_37182_1 [Eumeta japonica]
MRNLDDDDDLNMNVFLNWTVSLIAPRKRFGGLPFFLCAHQRTGGGSNEISLCFSPYLSARITVLFSLLRHKCQGKTSHTERKFGKSKSARLTAVINF